MRLKNKWRLTNNWELEQAGVRLPALPFMEVLMSKIDYTAIADKIRKDLESSCVLDIDYNSIIANALKNLKMNISDTDRFIVNQAIQDCIDKFD